MVIAILFLVVGLVRAHDNQTTIQWALDTEQGIVTELGTTSLPSIIEKVIIDTEEFPPTTSTSTVSSTTITGTEPWSPEVVSDYTFPIRDKDKTICLLAKFHATFNISYTSHRGNQTVVIKLPEYSRVNGTCGSSDQLPILEISWKGFSYTLIFSKRPYRDKENEESWYIKSMELMYDSTGPLFDGAKNAGKKIVKSLESQTIFETPIGKSYYCPTPDVIYLYNIKKERKVITKLKDVQIQPYDVDKNQFSDANQCSQVAIASRSEISFRDETVPIAVGSTFAILTLIGVSGYAVYRTVTARRVDYSTME